MNVLGVCVKEGKDQKLLGDINLRADWIEPAGSPVGLGGKVSVQCKLLCAVLGAHKNLSHKILSCTRSMRKKGGTGFFRWDPLWCDKQTNFFFKLVHRKCPKRVVAPSPGPEIFFRRTQEISYFQLAEKDLRS